MTLDVTTYWLSSLVMAVEYEVGKTYYAYNSRSPEWSELFETFERRELGKLFVLNSKTFKLLI